MNEVREQSSRETGIAVEVTCAGSGCLLLIPRLARSGEFYVPGERQCTGQARADGHAVELRAVAEPDSVPSSEASADGMCGDAS